MSFDWTQDEQAVQWASVAIFKHPYAVDVDEWAPSVEWRPGQLGEVAYGGFPTLEGWVPEPVFEPVYCMVPIMELQPGVSKAAPAVEGNPWHPAEVAKRQGIVVQENGPLSAKAAGFPRRVAPKEAPFNSHGQESYTDGNRYITPDVDGHNGGTWKMFDRKGNRVGTYNTDMEKIGK
ncbi:MAG: toxin C-terminal domain-containing protein [Polyangiaceae bacterium]